MSDPLGAGTRWNARYRQSSAVGEAALFLDEVEHWLPGSGSMVDVAGGLGANARWFASRGHDVTVIDVSAVALDEVQRWATHDGVSVACIQRDIEVNAMPDGLAWDIALMHLYFDRDVLVALPRSLNPGGVLLFAQPTTLNLQRHERPGPRFLLEPGQLADLVAAMESLTVVELSEDWRSSGRHEARLVARAIR